MRVRLCRRGPRPRDDRRDGQERETGGRVPPRREAPHVRACVSHATTSEGGVSGGDASALSTGVRCATGLRERQIMAGAYQTVEEIGIIRPMAQGLRDLVGRVMIDPEFLAELQRAPEPLLAEYELSDAERATVQQALARLAKTPSSQRRHEFRSSLISRVAT